MKKKISKIVAVFLAAIMIIAGISPVQLVQAAEKMNFNVKSKFGNCKTRRYDNSRTVATGRWRCSIICRKFYI